MHVFRTVRQWIRGGGRYRGVVQPEIHPLFDALERHAVGVGVLTKGHAGLRRRRLHR